MLEFKPPVNTPAKTNHNYSLSEVNRDLLKELADVYQTTASGALGTLIETYAPSLIADVTNAPPHSTRGGPE